MKKPVRVKPPQPRTFAEFCKLFAETPISHAVRIGPRWFSDPEGLIASARAKGWEPFSGGVYLGEERGHFRPTSALITMLASQGGPRVEVDDRAAWLYLCGRDILMEGATNGTEYPAGKLVFIVDFKARVLGYGMIFNAHDSKRKSSVFVKHLLDLGEYLRRER